MNSKIAVKKVGRKTSHKVSLQRNLINDVIIYEHLTTTLAKSKLVISEFDKLITYIKSDKTVLEKSRVLINKLQNENSVKKLIEVYQKRFSEGNCGFLNVYKIADRKGDAAKMVKLIVKGYVYKDIGKRVNKKITKKAVSGTEEKTPEYLEAKAYKGTSGKSQVVGSAGSTKVKTRSGI
jgi:large subunit ribosomal protein L17